MRRLDSLRRPSLLLASAAVASGWAAAFMLGLWVLLFALGPVHLDFRVVYVAAKAGLRYGWSSSYDMATLRALSTSFPVGERTINSAYTFLKPPLLAWLVAPLTVFSEPMAYGLWTVGSLASLVGAWLMVAPYRGLARLTLLLLAIGFCPPILSALYYGQPTMVILLLIAAAWWCCEHDRPLTAGAAIALATFLKPQDVVMVPMALLVSGRYRVVMGWLGACLVLGLATIGALGPSGVIAYWEVIRHNEAVPISTVFTLAHLIGFSPVSYALWALQGVAALVVARRRRLESEMVFAAGLLGSVVVAFHFFTHDYSMLVLAAWMVLRTSPPLWHRLWLLCGVASMQIMVYISVTPQLIWDAGWLAILATSGLAASSRSLTAHQLAASKARAET